MILQLILFLIIIIIIYYHADLFYFERSPKINLETFNMTNLGWELVNIQNKHYAIFKPNKNQISKGKKNRVMIIAHGNAGSFLSRDYLLEKLSNYSGDIYLLEYPGFSGVKGITNIKNCCNSILFWINYVKPHYEKIDLYGESIGGGLIIETCYRYQLNFINKIYLQSTFTSLKDVIKDMNKLLSLIYSIFLLDDLNTYKKLDKISCKKFVVIHSKQDELIDYSQGIKNYLRLKSLGKKVKFIKANGSHGNSLFCIEK